MRNGRVAQVDSDSVSRHRRARAGRRRLGLRRHPRRDRARASRRALARALAIAAASRRRPPAPLAPVPPRARPLGLAATRRDPFDVSLEDKLELLLAAEAALRGDPRIVAPRRRVREPARAHGVRLDRGRGLHAGAHRVRRRRSPRSPSTATSCRCAPTPARTAARRPAPAGSTCSASTSPRTRRASPTRRSSCSPRRRARPAARRSSSTASSSRCRSTSRSATRSSSTACCSARPPTPARAGSTPPTSARCATARSSCTSPPTRRCPAGSAPSAGTTRASRRARRRSIEAGVLRAALSDRQSAAAIGLERSGGCARADGFARQPIVRMTNVSLEPGGAGTLDDLIADTDDGLYLETNRSWSIDDRRLHFQFAHRDRARDPRRRARAAAAQRLLRGHHAALLGQPRRGLLARGVAAARPVNCGKGEPGQMMRVSHGAAPARFRDVQVGRGVSAPTPARDRRARARAAPAATRRSRVVRERSLHVALRALGADAGDRGRRHDASRSCALRDGHVGERPTNRLDDDALRATARRAARRGGRGRGARRARRRRTRASPRAGAEPRAHDGFDAATARARPAAGGAALRDAFAVAAERGLEAFGVWTAGDVSTAIAASTGVRARTTASPTPS